ncbi:MAG: DUF2851 family protein [Bacteroidales bacterium]|nr:DUF2851 family protein [Bacteroidales bacterium]
MTEDFLHFIWKFKLAGQYFHTSTGEELQIVRSGEHNHDSGPDFLNAQVKIGDTLWAGNVEIHVRASDWTRHRHQFDEAYDNIILHVVFEDDLVIKRRSGALIPTLSLKEILHPNLFETYNFFLNNHLWIPCAFRLPEVRSLVISDCLTALSIERLERKAKELEGLLNYSNNDWNQAFYEALASTLGFRINKQPFEQMARQTPVQIIEKHKDSLFQVEAMLFGQAGLLEVKHQGEYPKRLKKEYQHLKHKFSLKPISGHLWKFMRLRPNNFPTIRLAQLAMMLHLRSHFFSEIIEKPEYDHLLEFFSVGVSDYWTAHYYFDRPSKNMGKTISTSTVELIMINNVIPFLFLYGKLKGQPRYQDKALALLDAIAPETNSIIRRFAEFGIKPDSASQSQALLELKTNYCDLKKCLECRIGLELIK